MIITKKHLRKKITSESNRGYGHYTVPLLLLPKRERMIQGYSIVSDACFLGARYDSDDNFIDYSEYQLDGKWKEVK